MIEDQEDQEFFLSKEQEKLVKSIIRKLKSANKDLVSLGSEWNIYVANDQTHIMRGHSHDFSRSNNALQQNSVDSVYLPRWGGGDW